VYLLHERPTGDGWIKAKGGRKGEEDEKGNELFGPRSPFLSSRVQSQQSTCVSFLFFLFSDLIPFFSLVFLSRSSSACLFFYLPRESNERVHREDAGHLLWRKEYENRTRKIVFFFVSLRKKRKWRFRYFLFSEGEDEILCAHGKLQPLLLNRRTKEMRNPLTKKLNKTQNKNGRLMMPTCWLGVCGDPSDPTG
jgi:hypothetical protein